MTTYCSSAHLELYKLRCNLWCSHP